MERNTSLKISEDTRALDPNVQQRKASNPMSSVWVSASAGTGKTKVLTDRVLRLLLPRSNGASGTKGHKILGLTFTKAAANEMRIRVAERLSEWAVIPEEHLHKELKKLLGEEPTKLHMIEARKLFADIIDTPGGLKIMTIHAFCQSVLSRFPLEANLPPYFTVLEEHDAKNLLLQAQTIILNEAEHEIRTPIGKAFTHLSQTLNEEQFLQALSALISEQRQLNQILKENFGIDGLYQKICLALKISTNLNEQTLNQSYCQSDSFEEAQIKSACQIMATSKTKTDIEHSTIISSWLEKDVAGRAETLEEYCTAFFTENGKGKMKSRLVTSKIIEANPGILKTLQKEAFRLLDWQEDQKKIRCADITRDLFSIGERIVEQYQILKRKQAALDFDDLILKTRDLIDQKKIGEPSWVMYKLDQGIDHILVDEAQDTNPEQWSIIESLCDDFFSGIEHHNEDRTIFVVGDEKQSIYSFQRASPEEFRRMKDNFAHRVKEAAKQWSPVDLNISFRTNETILNLVDQVFAQRDLRNSLSDHEINHQSFRLGQEGYVELWPLCESDDKKDFDPWDPPTTIEDHISGASKLAEKIANEIEGWIKNKTILPSRGRAIEPRDIMILLRTRNSFVHQLTRALKNKNVPVNGSDRMVLNTELAIEDCIAAAEFALCPKDDLTLACLLKSPLINISEEQLYQLAIDRKTDLWSHIQTQKSAAHIVKYLKDLMRFAQNEKPYEFFIYLLQSPCPADEHSAMKAMQKRLGSDILEPIEEFLNTVLSFQRSQIPQLQNFVHWHKSQSTEIKREMDSAINAVRIMTVHGSKGLQSPIVILPDTTRSMKSPPGQIDRKLIWPDKSNFEIPLFAPQKAYEPEAFKTAQDILDQRSEDEYARLLYVAMTRAEDRLYIGGHRGSRDPIDSSWYNYIHSAMNSTPTCETTEEGGLKLYRHQTHDGDRLSQNTKQNEINTELPDWLFTKRQDTHTREPLRKRASPEDKAEAFSVEQKQAIKRGNIIHKLLETLPHIEPEKRENAAMRFITQHGPELNNEEITQHILSLLNTDEFAQLFSKEAKAEVPISAKLPNGDIFNGKIDRLLITKNEIWIIDFKTGHAPETVSNIPESYKTQLEAYKNVLKQIYPNHQFHKAILWTDTASLMPIP